IMYLIFYVEALFHYQDVYRIADSFLPARAATVVLITALVTAGIGIPLRCYMISTVAFDHRRFGEKFLRLFPVLLAMDQLWAVASVSLGENLRFGAAFGAPATLLLPPFSQPTLGPVALPGFKFLANFQNFGNRVSFFRLFGFKTWEFFFPGAPRRCYAALA